MFFYNAHVNADRQFAKLNLQIWECRPNDAAAEWEDSPNEHNLQRMQRIRDTGKNAKYVDAINPNIIIQYQMDIEAWSVRGGEWYGPDIRGDFKLDTANTLAHIVTALRKAGLYPEDISPRALVDAIGAKPVILVEQVYSAYAMARDDADDMLAPHTFGGITPANRTKLVEA